MRDCSFIIPWIVCIIAMQCFNLAECGEEDSEKCDPETKFSTPEECDRECVPGEPSKICYYKFVVEQYTTASPACAISINNSDCILADNVSRTVIVVNRKMPGPAIKVCEGDKVIVDVTNAMSGRSISIHWHGLYQKETPYSDGVGSVTQCSINEFTCFRYAFKVCQCGTYWYHDHTALGKTDGLRGALIAKKPHSEDVNGKHYDIDEHCIILSDWMYELADERYPGRTNAFGGPMGQQPEYILVDGMGRNKNPDSPLRVYKVRAGKRYRFRMIGAMASTCPIMITCERHDLLCIATDGVSVEPRPFRSIVIYTGERYDFVIAANQTPGAYWIQFRALAACLSAQMQQLAILKYKGAKGEPSSPAPSFNPGLNQGTILNYPDNPCDGSIEDKICVSELRNAQELEDKDILADKPDFSLPLIYKLHVNPSEEKKNDLGMAIGRNRFRFAINEIFNIDAPGAMLVDYEKMLPDICSGSKKPAKCNNSAPCQCVHVHEVPKDCCVEMMVMNADPVKTGLNHPFHIHGYGWNLIEMGMFKNGTTEEIWDVIHRDRKNSLHKLSNKPVCKDTVAVPPGGYIITRFKSSNPGLWLLHCHFEYHLRSKMSMVIKVGDRKDWVPVPPNFPTCLDYRPDTVCTDEW